jgi:hypothetical protein
VGKWDRLARRGRDSQEKEGESGSGERGESQPGWMPPLLLLGSAKTLEICFSAGPVYSGLITGPAFAKEIGAH